jgi:phosphotransferase system enzyme I (PtsP)
VGFPPSAVDHVRLSVGEGITGFVAECLRPVSCAVGAKEEQWKPVPGLGEERFPSFLALPLLSRGACLGVLVLQRREARSFHPSDVELAAALVGPVASVIEGAKARRQSLESSRTLGPRSARLTGQPLAPGEALGKLEAPTPLAHAPASFVKPKPLEVATAFAEVAAELQRGRARLHPRLGAADRAHLAMLAPLLDDERLRETAIEECSQNGLSAGLRRVAREYARAAYRAGVHTSEGSEWMSQRAAEVEDLCMLVGAHARSERCPSAGGIVVTERLTTCLVLAMVARRCAGVALTNPVATDSPPARLLAASGIPAIMSVAELFVWARPDDRALIDGERGLLHVNPPPTTEARLRATSRQGRGSRA